MTSEFAVLEYPQLAKRFFRSWGGCIPHQDQVIQKVINNFSILLADTLVQAARASSVLTTADVFLEELETQLTPTEFSRARGTLELYGDFIVSREVFKFNPFKAASLYSVTNEFVRSELLSDQTSINSLPSPCKKEIPTYEKFEILLETQLDTRLTRGDISDRTYGKYRSDNLEFIQFLKEYNLDLSTESIDKYIKHLNEKLIPIKQTNHKVDSNTSTETGEEIVIEKRKLWESTIANKKTSIRSVLVDLVDDNLIQIEGNFRKALRTKESSKTAMKKHRALTLKEIELLMYALSSLSLQAKLEILVPLLSGARPDENSHLKVCSIDFATRRILFTKTKGRKARLVPVSIHLLEMLAKHIEEKGLSESDYLFSTRQSPKMSTRTLQNHLQDLRKAAGINRVITPHDLRSSFAYLRYYHSDQKFDLIALQKLMGHVKIDQTADYVGERFETEDKTTLEALIKRWCSILTKKTVNLSNVRRMAS